MLYILSFLHQTTTLHKPALDGIGCISYHFYIKPQLCLFLGLLVPVVYLIISTSNHNYTLNWNNRSRVVYLIISTSNHNYLLFFIIFGNVVYLIISTSNHNGKEINLHLVTVVYLIISTSNHNY